MFVVLTPAFFRIKTFTFSPVLSLAISQTVQVTRIQVSSIISSTNWLHLISTIALAENFSIIHFIISTYSIVLFSDLSTFHQALISICFVINSTNRNVSLMTLAIFFDRRTSLFTEQLDTCTLQVTKVVVSHSINTTYSIVKSFTMFTTSWLWIWAFSIMQFFNAFTFSLTVISVGFSIHSTDWLVDFSTATFLQTRSFILDMSS